MNSKSQRNGTPLATPAIPLQSQCPIESTEEYVDHVNEGLGPVYYSSVNGGDCVNELLCQYDYTSLPMSILFPWKPTQPINIKATSFLAAEVQMLF